MVLKKIDEMNKTAEMQKELNKHGKRTACGGLVWTVADLQRFFRGVKSK